MLPAALVLSYGFWVVGPVLQLLLVVVMVRRKLRKEFPLFFSYTVFQILCFALQFGAYRHSRMMYFYVYWVTSAIGVGLALCVIYEIFSHVFRPYESLRELGDTLFRWAALVMVLMGIIMALSGPKSVPNHIMATILVLERSVRIMQCGMVLFLFLFSRSFGLSARNHLFGIATGFGVFAAVQLIITSMVAVGLPGSALLNMVKGSAYDVAVVIWLGYMLSHEPARMPARYHVAERWNYALSGAQASASPFIPMIEDTVERVLIKTNGHNGHNGHNGNGHNGNDKH